MFNASRYEGAYTVPHEITTSVQSQKESVDSRKLLGADICLILPGMEEHIQYHVSALGQSVLSQKESIALRKL